MLGMSCGRRSRGQTIPSSAFHVSIRWPLSPCTRTTLRNGIDLIKLYFIRGVYCKVRIDSLKMWTTILGAIELLNSPIFRFQRHVSVPREYAVLAIIRKPTPTMKEHGRRPTDAPLLCFARRSCGKQGTTSSAQHPRAASLYRTRQPLSCSDVD
jgi:hypothetical protein